MIEPTAKDIATGYLFLQEIYNKRPYMLDDNREQNLIELLKCKTDHISSMKASEMVQNFKEHMKVL